MPLLTVVIPVYNVEKYLRECLDSIVNQTYKNLEIIIVNDCSPDHSEDIILEYQKNDPRIKYIKHEKNLGQGGARNTGITNATGEWITFVDSDDYIDLDTYECMMDLILKNNVDLGVFSAINFDDITKKETYNPYFNVPNSVSLSNLGNVTAWNKIYRLSDIVDNDMTFPEHLKHEDEAFWFKYVAVVEPTIIGTPKRFYHYRQREGSTMSQYSFRVDIGYIIQNIYKYLVEKDLFDKCKNPFLCRVSGWTYLYSNPLSKETIIKINSILHDFLQQFLDEELMPYPELFAIKNMDINEHSLEFLKNLRRLLQREGELQKLQGNYKKLSNIQADKWYVFGHMSRKQKIKFIIKTIIKRILKKLHLFEFAKSIKNKLLRR